MSSKKLPFVFVELKTLKNCKVEKLISYSFNDVDLNKNLCPVSGLFKITSNVSITQTARTLMSPFNRSQPQGHPGVTGCKSKTFLSHGT